MPELPEVERASRVFARAARGKTIARVRVLHPAYRRRLPDADAKVLRGARVERVERRGKHQLIVLDRDVVVHVHFRMTGDWRPVAADRATEADPLHARVVFEFTDGSRVALVDPRALGTLKVTPKGDTSLPELGPDALDRRFDARWLGTALASRRIAIKPALLDQRVVAGVGNIYAVEALWHARIDPRTPAASLDLKRRQALVRAVRAVLARAGRKGGRYYSAGGTSQRFAVYDRAGEPCPRCGTIIERLVQSGRSTYYCPACQD